MTAPAPLAVTVARADALGGPRRLVAASPTTPLPAGWTGLDAALDDPGTIARWVDDARAGFAAGQDDVAGAAVAAQVSGGLVGLALPPLLVADRGVPLRTSGLALHRHRGGWIDGVAVVAREVRVLGDDADAGREGTAVVDGHPTLVAMLADELVASLDPVFERIRAAAPFGRSGMWGTTVDELGLVATRLARQGAVAGDAAWATVEGLVDAIAERQPRLRGRPRRVDVDLTGGRAPFARRSTCCLFYKLAPPGPARQAAYCATCPLLAEAEQHERLAASATGGI